MARAFVLYNPLAGSGRCIAKMKAMVRNLTDEVIYGDVTASETCEQYFAQMQPDDYILICGGDGTLNRFVNMADVQTITNDILYFPCGSGNDFAHDIGIVNTKTPVSVKQYLLNLPTVTVNGNSYRFINGVGCGLDGHCIEEAAQIRLRTDKEINYTAIALKGLAYKYKPANATVTADGITRTYKKVWLVSGMCGRFYGGGLMPAPSQNREEDCLTVMLAHSLSKLKILMLFPTIKKGKHVKFTRYVEIIKCKEVTVSYDCSRAMQMDGEPILNVTTYTAQAPSVKQSNFTDKQQEGATV